MANTRFGGGSHAVKKRATVRAAPKAAKIPTFTVAGNSLRRPMAVGPANVSHLATSALHPGLAQSFGPHLGTHAPMALAPQMHAAQAELTGAAAAVAASTLANQIAANEAAQQGAGGGGGGGSAPSSAGGSSAPSSAGYSAPPSSGAPVSSTPSYAPPSSAPSSSSPSSAASSGASAPSQPAYDANGNPSWWGQYGIGAMGPEPLQGSPLAAPMPAPLARSPILTPLGRTIVTCAIFAAIGFGAWWLFFKPKSNPRRRKRRAKR